MGRSSFFLCVLGSGTIQTLHSSNAPNMSTGPPKKTKKLHLPYWLVEDLSLTEWYFGNFGARKGTFKELEGKGHLRYDEKGTTKTLSEIVGGGNSTSNFRYSAPGKTWKHETVCAAFAKYPNVTGPDQRKKIVAYLYDHAEKDDESEDAEGEKALKELSLADAPNVEAIAQIRATEEDLVSKLLKEWERDRSPPPTSNKASSGQMPTHGDQSVSHTPKPKGSEL